MSASCASPAIPTTSRAIMEELKGARARPGCGTCSCPTPTTARVSPTATTRRWRRSSGTATSPRRHATAPRLTPATWRYSICSPLAEQRERWLVPLLEGEIRSSFAMTEPDVASSDATNIALRIERYGDEYVLNGRKWWTSGALHPHCRIMIVMGKTQAGRPAPSPAEHGARAARHPRRGDPARRCPCSATRIRRGTPKSPSPTCACRRQSHRRRGRRLHDRPGPSRPGAHPPLHALASAPPSARLRRCAGGPSRASPSASP